MNTEERLDRIEKKIDRITETTIRNEEQIRSIRESIAPLKDDVVERCKNEMRAWGWKSLTTLVTALVSSLSALAIHFFQR